MAVIAGNWKMNLGPHETRGFFKRFDASVLETGHELILFPTTASLSAAFLARGEAVKGIGLGVQNIHWEDAGAFTGETSAPIAANAGAEFALVGHSERRHVFGETDEETGLKVAAARRHGLVPVLCVGETLEERRADRVDEVILRQLDAALPALEADGERFLVAYEPVWAIGTGETATPADASAAHTTLRRRLEEALGAGRASRVPILYGGSVKPDNAAELLAADEVGGVLVGGASLDPESFAAIVLAAGKAR
ncbi:MAG: triose-phosphate isomerase [Longimicrobiales bacterium]|nr:triose-phosphate isomerase [Longimicrobiales bacterium]